MNTFFRKNIIRDLVNKYVKKYQDYNYFNSKYYLDYVYRKKQGLINHAAEIETIALRGSTADYAFIPQCIENSYNLGLTSTDLYFSYQLYLKSKEMLPNLNNVVVYLAGFTNGFSIIRTNEKYRLVSYKYFFEIPFQEDGFIDQKIEKKIFGKCKNTQTIVPDDYWGYEEGKTFMPEMDARVRAKQIIRENRREPDQMVWIKKIIDQIVKDKKNIFIVIPPYTTALKSFLPPKEKLYEKTYSLLSNYKNIANVRLIDLYDSDLFDDSDMGDHDHPNEKGAKKSTMIVKEYIDNPVSTYK